MLLQYGCCALDIQLPSHQLHRQQLRQLWVVSAPQQPTPPSKLYRMDPAESVGLRWNATSHKPLATEQATYRHN